jgi:uncharacterized protein YcaQ
METSRKQKKYCEMSVAEKYAKNKDKTPFETYKLHRKEMQKAVEEQRKEEEEKENTQKEIEEQVEKLFAKEFKNLFK